MIEFQDGSFFCLILYCVDCEEEFHMGVPWHVEICIESDLLLLNLPQWNFWQFMNLLMFLVWYSIKLLIIKIWHNGMDGLKNEHQCIVGL